MLWFVSLYRYRDDLELINVRNLCIVGKSFQPQLFQKEENKLLKNSWGTIIDEQKKQQKRNSKIISTNTQIL